MKRNNLKFLIVILIAWLPWFIGAWDKTLPSGSKDYDLGDDDIRTNNTAIEAALDQDHDFTTGSTQTGKHNMVSLIETANLGTGAEGLPILGAQTAGGKAELVFTDEDDNDIQLTSGGNLYSSAGLTVTTNATFNGGITLGAGDDLIGSSTSDITFNTNKFTVAGASGNTVIAGTLDVAGNIDPTTYETTNGGFLDEDNMASDSATKVASQQSIKAYADTKEAAIVTQATAGLLGTTTTTDTDSGAFAINSVYQAQCDGFLIVYKSTQQPNYTVYTDGSNPPTTSYGNMRDDDGNTFLAYPLLVRKDDYWKVTGDANVFRWIPFGTGGCVKQ